MAKAKIKGMPEDYYAQYEVEVIFLREFSDDSEILEDNPKNDGLTFAEAAARQLAAELQEGFDKAGIAGQFVVNAKSIKVGSERFDAVNSEAKKNAARR